MPLSDVKPWEPEETVGTIWHNVVTKVDAQPHYIEAAVRLEEVTGRLGVLFRGLGGSAGVEIVPAAVRHSQHRVSRLRRIGMASEEVYLASFDGERLALPPHFALFPQREDNLFAYLWLTAMASQSLPVDNPSSERSDALYRDFHALQQMMRTLRLTHRLCPGLSRRCIPMARQLLAIRHCAPRSSIEADIDAVIRAELDSGEPLGESAEALRALLLDDNAPAHLPMTPRGYRSPEPVALWVYAEQKAVAENAQNRDHVERKGSARVEAMAKRKKAQRRDSSQASRRDSLILHRFETILSWTQFLNINRRVEDDDPEGAKKAAEDQETLNLTEVPERPATRLAFDLDMAPQHMEQERLSGEHLLPEWDYRRSIYHQDRCRILFAEAEIRQGSSTPPFADKQSRRRIRAIKRRFEALRPRRAILPRQIDGDELDMDALIRSQADLRAFGEGSDRIYKRIVNSERDLAVATLIDVSRSTEAVIEERPVIETAREALAAFGHGLQATGDAHAIYAFSSLRSNRVFVNRCKSFDEPMGQEVEQRIVSLRPGFYTRLGAAVRFVSKELAERGAQKHLLLIITDGKPNDIDHYEGRYGVEDTRKAVREARQMGQAVFAVTIDSKARQYISHIFGSGGYAIISHTDKLADALPILYCGLVA